MLDATDEESAAILKRQKVTRCGLHNLTFPEHFFWRYFDEKIKLQKEGFTEDQLRKQCIGIELYFLYLQTAGYIKVFNDSIDNAPMEGATPSG